MRSGYRSQVRFLQALANPKRLAVVCLLRHSKMPVSALERQTGMKQANVSQHLMTLRRAGVVVGRRKGRWVYYSLTQLGRLATSAALRSY